MDVGIAFERQEFQVAMNDFLGLLNHLEFGDPQGSLSDGNSEVVNLDAEELSDRNFNGIDKFAELNLAAE